MRHWQLKLVTAIAWLHTRRMAESGYLTNHFLIAMPTLLDPNFFHSVAYICEHNQHGAMAIIINQPVDLTGTAVFLASEDSASMTGQTLVVDNGRVMLG